MGLVPTTRIVMGPAHPDDRPPGRERWFDVKCVDCNRQMIVRKKDLKTPCTCRS